MKKTAFIQRLGKDTPCAHCGAHWNGEGKMFHWHHVDKSTKKFSISNNISCSIPTLLEELAKCIYLCPTCHAIHHNNERIAIPTEVNGVKYASRAEAERLSGVHRNTIRYRELHGHKPDEPMNGARKTIEFEGKTYASINDAARETGLDRNALARALKEGRTSLLRKHTISVEIDGVVYKTLTEAAKSIGVSRWTIMERLKKGIYNTKEKII